MKPDSNFDFESFRRLIAPPVGTCALRAKTVHAQQPDFWLDTESWQVAPILWTGNEWVEEWWLAKDEICYRQEPGGPVLKVAKLKVLLA
jgi:hypothetical protein